MRALEHLLGHLGSDPTQHKISMPKKSNNQTSKKRIHHTFGTPYGRPKSTKIDSKTNQNFRRFSRAKKMLFKSLLEPSWADLGPLQPPKSCCGPHGARFFKNHMLLANRTWKPDLAAKSAQNDPNLAPQDDPKSIKNRRQKSIEILIDNKPNFMRPLGPIRRNALASWGDYRGV